jgi:hypothetical protein
MKNHWLDKKADRELDLEIDKACEEVFAKEEFKDTGFIDLSTVMNRPDRFEEYDRLIAEDKVKVSEKFLDELNAAMIKEEKKGYDILTATDKEDRDMVKAILLKNFHKSHWIEEILTDIKYSPHLAPGPDLGNITMNCGYGFSTTLTETFVGITPGDDGITLNDNVTTIGGFPQDDEYSKVAGCCGDFACNCSANLDSWYPDNSFIQNEKLQLLSDEIVKGKNVTKFQTMYTPVVPGTMTGTMYWVEGGAWGWVFCVMTDGTCDFRRYETIDGKIVYPHGNVGESQKDISLQELAEGDSILNLYYDEVYTCVGETGLDLATGVLQIHHNFGIAPQVIVNYEYQKVNSL